MKTEVSAGGVVVRRRGAGWQVLLIRDMNNTWTFPKGLIEPGEKPAAAAVREIGEEVGLTRIRQVSRLSTIGYTYRRNGLIQKTVHYFLFETTGTQKLVCQKEEGIRDARWVGLTRAIQMVGYEKTNVPLLELTRTKLAKINV